MAENSIPLAQSEAIDANRRFTKPWFRFLSDLEGLRRAISTGVATALLKASNLSDVADAATAFGNIKQSASGATTGVVKQTQTGSITFQVERVQDKGYTVILKSPVERTVTSITTESASGTCTLTGTIDGVALGGTANSVSSTESEQAHSSANVVGVGEDLVLTASSNSSCLDMVVTVKYTYALDA